MMKTSKLGLSVAMGLLLGASATQAANVILDASGTNVLRIENLLVPIDIGFGEATVYDVEFKFDNAVGVYGSPIDFDFQSEENALVALRSVNGALNENDPIPTGAGPNGTSQYFIGLEEEDVAIAGIGGENIGGVWSDCELDCGPAATAAWGVNDEITYADFGDPRAVPLPAAAWLFGSSLLGLIGMARRKKA